MSRKEQLVLAFLLSTAVAYWVYLQSRPDRLSNHQLYSMFYRPIDLDSASGELINDDLSILGLEYYRKGEFDNAEEIFESIYQIDSASINNKWFLAQAKMAQNEVHASIPLLYELKDTGEYNQEAEWYLALAYLRYGKLDASTKCLQRLDSLNYRYTEVTNLLEHLEN